MPLLDHFHPPLSERRHWEAFHARWASAISDALNRTLPEDYFAEPQVHVGPRVEVDVATLDERQTGGGRTATLPQTAPALTPADLTLPAAFPAVFGVRVYDTSGGPTLVAAVELVSPGNKDREEARRAFSAKCATYLQQAIGLIVVDIVTNRHSRPFAELMAQMYPGQALPADPELSAVSYRPVRVEGADSLELRIQSLNLGQPLPELPLALGGVGHVMLDLEATYEEARERGRL